MKSKAGLRSFPSVQKRRAFLEKELNISLDKIGQFNFTEDQVTGRNIENLIGAAQIPLGVAGPLTLRTTNYELRTVYIPLATTEGALIASVSRGCKAVTLSGGAVVIVEDAGITRGPVFKTSGIIHSQHTKAWIEANQREICQAAEATSNHLKLKNITCAAVANNLFVRFQYHTGDAMGMNMATFATQQAAKLIEEKTQACLISLAGNFDIDKKSAWLNFISGRGKKAWAEVTVPKKIISTVLKTTAPDLAELVYRKCLLGSAMAGSLGFNAHFSNIIAAVFAATGQDLAHVVEGSLGVTSAESLPNGDLYFSVYLPSLVVGTVGGGTHLPGQKEAIQIMKVSGVLEYAAVLAAIVLAGELSLTASLAEGSLAETHKKLGRRQKIDIRG